MTTWLNLTLTECAALTVLCFVAGVVRGFSGFALSALVMSVAVMFMPPVELIPMLWFLEMSASLMMVRGGIRDAQHMTVFLLVAGAWAGWPVGLSLTSALPVEQSRLVVLVVILALSGLQFSRRRIPGLATRPGTFLAGLLSGIVSGLAHVGGMVVALYVLSQGSAARQMRGTLVLYLFIGALGSFLIQLLFGVMTKTAVTRGMIFVPVTLLGVWLGSRLFVPRWESYYRPFCLSLLIAISAAGLLRLATT